MEKLLQKYKDDYWPSLKINKRELLDSKAKNNLQNAFFSSPFISDEFKKKLEKIVKSKIIKYTFTIKLNQGNVNFHFVTNQSTNFVNKIAKYFFFVIFLRLNLNSQKRLLFLENMYINLLPVNISKTFNNNMNIHDINSASTIVYPDFYGGPIFIWRADEIEKVLIHETLHSVHYDTNIINQNLITVLKNMEEKCCKNGMNINEAYTELCASFIFNLFKSNSKKLLKKHLLKELDHSLHNCARLLEENNISKDIENLFLNNYKQEASAFSYIILKTGLLWLMLDKCKSKIKAHTDKIRCLEEFIEIGFWGNIGISYQDIIVSLMQNKDFIKKIVKRYSKKKRGRPEKLILVI